MSDDQPLIPTLEARRGLEAAWVRILNERHPGLRAIAPIDRARR